MNASMIKQGYEPFIDYLKGICIFFVLINHSTTSELIHKFFLYSIWIYLAVPVFLIIQAWQVYKKENIVYPSAKKIFKRICKPFIIVSGILFFMGLFRCFITDSSYFEWIKKFVISGGMGPGSYYVWVYIQFAILIPLLYPLCKSKFACIYFIFVSVAYEMACYYMSIPYEIYRICCLRYVFLIYLGYLWAKLGLKLDWKTLLLSIISIVLILYNRYFKINLLPFVYDDLWLGDHWFMYFVSWSLFPFIVYKFYSKFKKSRVTDFLIQMGGASYQLFMFQMIVFCIPVLNTMPIINLLVCFIPMIFLSIKSKHNLL